ncbi:helix-turn-helix transcriptional regulator [Intestinimonas sp.]|uniref:helix-turn-helix domain-containing protein n=1 Tax=Intestinimonas sp. TaxID=1965293 RepID=UPI00260A5AD3|nr:helix-turn-helix transcriptional regulator [Intestinimonas sp.]
MGFAQNLKYLMEHYGLTNYQLAKELNCSPSSVANWLSGVSRPQKRTVTMIAAKFDVSEEDICGDPIPHIKGEIRLRDTAPPHKIAPTDQKSSSNPDLLQKLEMLSPEDQEEIQLLIEMKLARRKQGQGSGQP